jgi:hypothetical protein
MIYDVPHRVVVALAALEAHERRRLRHLLIGGRCLQEGLKGFLQGIGMMGNGGDFFRQPAQLLLLNCLSNWLMWGSQSGLERHQDARPAGRPRRNAPFRRIRFPVTQSLLLARLNG